MFKIESYITPIILSYLEKYVKNIRPEDSQASLCGGEVVFQNLDLKLDVLEEELQLPFNFLSGHIQELSIRVPWTKIASEPIVITINTIEFVLKLRDSNDRNVPKREPPRRGKSADEAPPPGYMASLISKIANNISIRCHNVILKYVEEDIVVSMNIQQLSMESADGSWNPAFIDLSPTKVSLRKLINVVDLTICLDKRNSAGKIEVCQEPVLYRSTLQIRMLVKYSVSSQDRSSLTRIDIHSKFLDFNVSSQQFPMLMRLFDLALALKQGKITTGPAQPTADRGQDVEDESGQESLLSWAWNLLPSFFPEENESDHSEEHDFRVLHAGVYIDQLRVIFKTQELIDRRFVDPTKKIKYIPVLRFDFHNFYGEMVTCGLKWFNVTLGISRVQIQSLDDCPCGQSMTVKEIFDSTENEQQSECTHLETSFFSDNAGGNRKYNVNWNRHLSSYSQEYLLQKSPAIAIDIIHEVQLPDDRRTSEFGSDLEFSNLAEKYMIRIFVGKFRAKLCADTIHRFRTLAWCMRNVYEYPSYYEEKPLPTLAQLPPPSAEDYEALMHEIPLRQIHITLQNPTIELHSFDHNPVDVSIILGKIYPPKPSLTVQLNRAECNILAPLYPNRLVYTTCQLPEPPAKLFDACYQSISGNLERLQVKLHRSRCDTDTVPFATAVSMNFQQRLLIHPELWPNPELIKMEQNVTVTDLKVVLNPFQGLVFGTVVHSLVTLEYVAFYDSLPQSSPPTIDMLLSYVHLRKVEAERTKCYKMIARSFKLLTYHEAAVVDKSLTILCPSNSSDEDFLTLIFQLPKDFNATIEHPPLFYAKLLDFTLNVDPNLLAFLNATRLALKIRANTAFGFRFQTQAALQHVRSSDHPKDFLEIQERLLRVDKITAQNELHFLRATQSRIILYDLYRSVDKKHSLGVTSALRRSDKVTGKVGGQVDTPYWAIFGLRMIFDLEVNQITLCFPERLTIFRSCVSVEGELYECGKFKYKLPLITANSSIKFPTLIGSINRFPISFAASVWAAEKFNLPWTITVGNCSGQIHPPNEERSFEAPDE